MENPESATTEAPNPSLAASFSTLTLSIASNAAIALGLETHPQTQQLEVDLPLARFNIDLLMMLKEKTMNNLVTDEQKFLDHLLRDLQLQFVHVSQKKG